MSFYDDASLVFLPSGEAGKDGKAYSMKPTNGNGDFTFSRGSNLTATRVDSNGLIEKGRENLLLQSNQFDTTWTFANVSATSGQSGYDGSNDAWKITSTNTGQSFVKQIVSNSGVATCSVYAKADTANFIVIYAVGGGDARTFFDLQNGTTEYALNHITNKIEDVGNGWYKCSVIFNKTISDVRLFVADSNNVYNSGNGSSIYIQDAQLEIGLAATEYIESGATTGLAGILEDSPRFDYSGGATCPSLLLEPSRTQLVTYSEYFDSGSDWDISPNGSALAAVITNNYAISPEGVQNATRIQFDLNGGTLSADRSRIKADFGVGTSGSQSHSIYIKSNDGVIQNVTFRSLGTLTNHEITSNWERIDLISTDDSLFFELGIYGNTSYNDTADISIWGAQIEEGSYATSYIPNHSGGSVTREADVNTLLNQSGVIGQTAGTILFDAYFDEAEKVNFSISDSSVSNFISIETTSSNEVTAKVEQGGSTQATITTTSSFFAEGDRLKCAIAYDDRDMAFYINGTQVNTAAPNLIPTCDDVRFGNYDGSIKADQRVNRVLLFTTRISDNNLATLTS